MQWSSGSLIFLLFALNGCAQTPVKSQSQNAVATVGGKPIYDEDLAPFIETKMRRVRMQEYEVKSEALESLINQKLVEAEAAKKRVSKEKLLEQEVDSKASKLSDEEVEAYYKEHQGQINRPLEQIKDQLREAMQRGKLEQARQDYFRSLRQKSEVKILLRPPKLEVGIDPGRLRGDPKAPVTIVEFSDFQCPFCVRVQGTLRDLLTKYKGRVNLAYRDFPLDRLHPRATKAAEASRCAGEQGKFWEYHDLIWGMPGKLDDSTFSDHAKTLKLDSKRFDSCLTGGKFRTEVEKDAEEGTQAGVEGTPAFFINGVFLNGAQPAAAFERVIAVELAAAESK